MVEVGIPDNDIGVNGIHLNAYVEDEDAPVLLLRGLPEAHSLRKQA